MPSNLPTRADPSHIETRLLVVAEMLEKAVAEVRRTMAEIKTDVEATQPPTEPHPVTDPGSTDVRN